MKKINVALVDDEISNVEILTKILETQHDEVQIVWTATNLESARKNIREKEIDLLFLDIELPPYNSFQLLDSIENPNFEVVFVTAFQEHALKALKMAALDYIIKPVRIDDIVKVINKLKTKNKFGEITNLIKDQLDSLEKFSKIVVHVNDGYDIVDINNIIHIEALDSYSKIKLTGNISYVTSRPLKEFEELLADKGFYRIHKSYLINLRHMMKIIKGGTASVIMTNGTCIPVSTRKKETFFTELKGIISF